MKLLVHMWLAGVVRGLVPLHFSDPYATGGVLFVYFIWSNFLSSSRWEKALVRWITVSTHINRQTRSWVHCVHVLFLCKVASFLTIMGRGNDQLPCVLQAFLHRDCKSKTILYHYILLNLNNFFLTELHQGHFQYYYLFYFIFQQHIYRFCFAIDLDFVNYKTK